MAEAEMKARGLRRKDMVGRSIRGQVEVAGKREGWRW